MKPIQSRIVYPVSVRLAVVGLCLVAALPAAAQVIFQTGFEPPDYQGSPEGVLATGQQGWYLPVAGSMNQSIYTYDGNTLGLPTNTLGEIQFLGGQVMGSNLARAQHDVDFSAGGVFTASYDFAAGFNGIPPAGDNVGSFSLQDSLVARFFIALNFWVPGLEGSQWIAGYLVFDPNGVQFLDPFIPGPQWLNLAVNHWYRQSTTFDFTSNTITSVSITDLETGDTATFAPSGWYLAGGAGGGGLPLPTGLRFFVGGDVNPGNLQGFDNVLIAGGAAPAPNGEEAPRPLSMPLAPGAATQ